MRKYIVMVILASVGLNLQAQQACYSTVPVSAPAENFTVFGNGQVLDLSTNLMWMQCSLGQTSANGTCSGEAEPYTWKQALELSVGYSYNDSTNWRLPNIKELSSITERSCTRPSIDIELFPATPPDDFWSSTPSMLDPERAWVLAFFNSSNSIKAKNRAIFVRLVRPALPAERE
jgi:hypothetical protein